MSDVASLIADMVRAGVDPELIGRTAAALSQREAVVIPDEGAERRRAADRERKRLRKSAEVGGMDDDGEKETSPTPPKEKLPPTKENTPLRGVQKKPSRIPADFQPDLDWAVGAGLMMPQAEVEAAKFRDYWTSKGGNATKTDWPATWRNWVRSALERVPTARGSPPLRGLEAVAARLRRDIENEQRQNGTAGLDLQDDERLPLLTGPRH